MRAALDPNMIGYFQHVCDRLFVSNYCTPCHEAKVYLNLYWTTQEMTRHLHTLPFSHAAVFRVDSWGCVYPYLQMQRRSVAGWHWHGPVNATTHLWQSWWCFFRKQHIFQNTVCYETKMDVGQNNLHPKHLHPWFVVVICCNIMCG
jgi:hypothetical protein